jgi:formylglycine-generating enzyme required for sulfatase activity
MKSQKTEQRLRVLMGLWILVVFLSTESRAERLFFRLRAPHPTAVTRWDKGGALGWSNTVVSDTVTVQITTGIPPHWRDYVQNVATSTLQANRVMDPNCPSGRVFIPAGIINMGNCLETNEGWLAELPVHTVYVSAFYMDRYEVTQALWEEVYTWALSREYSFTNGAGKASTHPVQQVNWYDTVKWCNARSQMEGRVPAYYTDEELTQVYRSGQISPYVKWSAGGYRLPTEAEWEKAARGGAIGMRFSWYETNTIQHLWANYFSILYAYDISSTQGYHPAYTNNGAPYTSPAGSFSANGYGLYDMVGNVSEWCWDWFDEFYYEGSAYTNPVGSATGLYRVFRGGGWNSVPYTSRVAFRDYDGPGYASSAVGFRTVLPAPPTVDP